MSEFVLRGVLLRVVRHLPLGLIETKNRTSWHSDYPWRNGRSFWRGSAEGRLYNLARDNQVTLDLQNTNLQIQGYWPPLQDKQTSPFVVESDLAKHIKMDTLDTVDPDTCHLNAQSQTRRQQNISQYIQPMREGARHSYTGPPQILHRAYMQSQQTKPDIHKAYGNPDFAMAVNCLLSSYTNKRTK